MSKASGLLNLFDSFTTKINDIKYSIIKNTAKRLEISFIINENNYLAIFWVNKTYLNTLAYKELFGDNAIKDYSDEIWEVEFGLADSKGKLTDYLTGKGHPFKVFSVMGELINKFVQMKSPWAYVIVCKSNRAKLYRKLIGIVSKQSKYFLANEYVSLTNNYFFGMLKK